MTNINKCDIMSPQRAKSILISLKKTDNSFFEDIFFAVLRVRKK